VGLDVDKFINSKFDEQTEEVEVPYLVDFFSSDEKPVMKIRGLTGIEMGFVNESVDRSKTLNNIVEKLLSKSQQEKVEGVLEGAGLSEETPEDVVRRIEILKKGIKEPENITHDFALKFCTRFPVEFFDITNKILTLTGKGQAMVKPSPSGKKKKSEE